METPTAGIFFPENIPTNSSYLPPADIDPTPFSVIKIVS